jgi:hypothetical protein
MAKANLYRLQNPHRLPKPKEYDPDKEISPLDRHFLELERHDQERSLQERRRYWTPAKGM